MPVYRDFLTIFGRDGDGDPVTFGFWTGEDDITTNVTSAQDGSTDSRDFIGGAVPEKGIPPIVDSIGLESQVLTVRLSQIHPAVQDMVRGNDIRVAVVELHRGEYDPETWSLIDDPEPIFLGRIDGAPIETPAVGGEGSIGLKIIADTIDLTRTSPALKSDETQRLRSDDRFRRHADTAGNVEVWWGQQKGTA